MSITESEPDSAELAVATRGLVRRFGRDEALRGIDLRVPCGSVYVLVGPNGAGKSTAMRILLNLERADTGTATVFGLDSVRDGGRVRAQIGYVPEHPVPPHGWLRGSELLRYAASYRPTWDAAYARRLVEGLGVRLDRRVSGLSKGETRRLQLVLALAFRPRLLLLDEPTDGLDPVVRKRVWTVLAEHLADSPTTVLVATHQVHQMERLADHVGVMASGRLVAQLASDDLRRTVLRYRMEVPTEWHAPIDLRAADLRRRHDGREVLCTVIGDEREVVECFTRSGAAIREITPLSFEEAALALLPQEVT